MTRAKSLKFRRDGLKFLIRLSEADPTVLASSDQPGDLINLLYGLFRFHFLAPPSNPAEDANRLAGFVRSTPDAFRRLIAHLKELLAAAADGTTLRRKLLQGTEAVFDGVALKAGGVQESMYLFSPASAQNFWDGFEQAVAVSAMRVLAVDEGMMVRRCARESCKPSRRIFFASRPKQVYCSRQCASAAAFERHKEGLGEDEYRRRHAETAGKSAQRRKRRKALKSAAQRVAGKEEIS